VVAEVPAQLDDDDTWHDDRAVSSAFGVVSTS
jgi:hypothetical protein